MEAVLEASQPADFLDAPGRVTLLPETDEPEAVPSLPESSPTEPVTGDTEGEALALPESPTVLDEGAERESVSSGGSMPVAEVAQPEVPIPIAAWCQLLWTWPGFGEEQGATSELTWDSAAPELRLLLRHSPEHDAVLKSLSVEVDGEPVFPEHGSKDAARTLLIGVEARRFIPLPTDEWARFQGFGRARAAAVVELANRDVELTCEATAKWKIRIFRPRRKARLTLSSNGPVKVPA